MIYFRESPPNKRSLIQCPSKVIVGEFGQAKCRAIVFTQSLSTCPLLSGSDPAYSGCPRALVTAVNGMRPHILLELINKRYMVHVRVVIRSSGGVEWIQHNHLIHGQLYNTGSNNNGQVNVSAGMTMTTTTGTGRQAGGDRLLFSLLLPVDD